LRKKKAWSENSNLHPISEFVFINEKIIFLKEKKKSISQEIYKAA